MGKESILKEEKKEKFKAETLIRNATTNNVRHIVNADRKARIIILVNATIISILISLTSFQVPSQILTEIPKAVLLITNIISLLFALKAVGSLHTAKGEAKRKLKNLLDYEEYGNMTFDDYLRDMKNILADNEKILEYAIIDLYEQGQLLQKKYKYLGAAFRVFGLGMLIAILISLVIQFLF